MVSILAFCAIFAVCGLMLWGSYKIEPHWVSKNGDRLICYGQGITRDGEVSGRWRELRISRVRDDTVEVRPRRGSLAVDRPMGNPMRITASLGRNRHIRKATYWKVAGQQPSPVRNRVLYMLDGNNEPSMPEMIAIRVPKTSRAIPMLDALHLNRAPTASRRNPGTTQSGDQPDPG